MKLAVVGSGISGLSAAYHFSKNHKVDLFEQDDHFGGHAFTYDIKNQNETVPVDLGFIVFNELTYPNLINLFKELSVPFEKSDMSFSVSIKNSKIEYSGRGLNAIFANKLNIFNLSFLKMWFWFWALAGGVVLGMNLLAANHPDRQFPMKAVCPHKREQLSYFQIVVLVLVLVLAVVVAVAWCGAPAGAAQGL